MRRLLILLLAGWASAFAAPQESVRFDLGREPHRQASKTWNALTEPHRTGVLINGALDEKGRRTRVRWRQLEVWGEAGEDRRLATESLPEQVATDWFAADRPTRLRLEGLQPGARYEIALFGVAGPTPPLAAQRFRSGERQARVASADSPLAEWRIVSAADLSGQLEITIDGRDEARTVLAALAIHGRFPQPVEARAPAEDLAGPPLVSAAAWGVADGETGELLWSHEPDAVRQVASTTKIMTGWIAAELASANPEILDRRITVTEAADRTGGSTAGLRTGEELAVRDLLFALLLPSGNDASIAVAEVFGRELGATTDGEAVSAFIAEMNRRASELELEHTRYEDPHGNSANSSCVRDLVRLAILARQNELFRQIASTRRYECLLKTPANGTRQVTWRNTNQLLDIEGYDGIKTGTTTGAGACLVSTGVRDGRRLIVVVLGSTSRDGRYVDSRNLFRYGWRELGCR